MYREYFRVEFERDFVGLESGDRSEIDEVMYMAEPELLYSKFVKPE